MNARQDHSHAVVCVCRVQPYKHKIAGDIVEAVGKETTTNPEYRAVAGWRVGEWDGEQVRFEPWWWLAVPAEDGHWLWYDVQPDGKEYEYIMDHDLCIARILELEQRLQVRPCDLIHKDNNWYLAAESGLVWIPELSTKLILSYPRPTAVTISITSAGGVAMPTNLDWGMISIPQVTTGTASTK
jgi:hypothetical protein